MKWTRCSDALYYDLVKIPHGHVPAPRVKLWSWLPLPVKGYRTEWTFSCPVCGRDSFFKVFYRCRECEWDNYEESEESWKRRSRREKWRNRWKKLEYAMLPLLVLFGKAGYLRTTRIHARDLSIYGGKLTNELREEIAAERAKFIEKYGGYIW